jgi:siroheme synthase-like protein
MTGTQSYLMALVLAGKKCLVIGGDEEAAARARGLVETGAVVVVVTESAGPELEALAATGAVSLERRGYADRDLEGAWLVLLTARDSALLERVGPACHARRILFCGVDQPAHNSANHVGMARSGPVTLAVSTGGRAPALARRLREELERVMKEASFGAFAERVAELRAQTPGPERKRVLARALADLRLGPWQIPE